jgi:uncharacterized lipoprotein
MKIKVLKTTIASKDKSGCYSQEYQAGQVYDMYQELANTFIKQKWGVSAEAVIIKSEPVLYDIPSVEVENKAIQEGDIEAPQVKPKKKKNKHNS